MALLLLVSCLFHYADPHCAERVVAIQCGDTQAMQALSSKEQDVIDLAIAKSNLEALVPLLAQCEEQLAQDLAWKAGHEVASVNFYNACGERVLSLAGARRNLDTQNMVFPVSAKTLSAP